MVVTETVRFELAPPGGRGGDLQSMTFPALRHLLALQPDVRYRGENDHLWVQPLALVAVADDEAIALALVVLPMTDDEDHDPELLSLFVHKPWRRRGVATELVRQVEDELVRRGLESIRAVYMTKRPFSEPVERIFQKRGFEAPVPRMVHMRMRLDKALQVPFINRPLGHRYEIFPWSEITVEDRRGLIASQHEDGWIAPDLVPWNYEQDLEPSSSLGLRYQGEVVGWLINHAIRDETVRLTCGYIRPDLGRLGRALPMWRESFRRMAEAGFRQFTQTTPIHHPEMKRVIVEWCGPWASLIAETRGVVKVL